MSAIMEDKQHIFVFTSSHGRKKRGFPKTLCNLLDGSKRYYIEEEDIYAVPGQEINDNVVQQIKEKVTQMQPQKTVIVINLADNNLRPSRQGKETPEDLIPYFRAVMEHCKTVPSCQVVLSSLIPGIGHDEATKSTFKTMNSLLKNLCHEYRDFSSFCPFNNQLIANGTLNAELYRDDVHLNRQGYALFANAIYLNLIKLPKLKSKQ